MTDDTATTTTAVVETIEHVFRLHRKIETLQTSLRDSLAAAGSLAGEMGQCMDYATFYRLAGEMRERDIPGRGVFTGGKQLPPPPGTVLRRHRDANEPPWPGACPCVYVLINSAAEVIYIGKSKQVGQRITQHRAKPWEWCEVIVCDSEQAALDLEGDLIFQHQPDLNRAGRWERPGPTGDGESVDHDTGEFDRAELFAHAWNRWGIDGVSAPLPPMRELEKSIAAWLAYSSGGLTFADLLDLIPIALERVGVLMEDRWRYYCGVAWNHAREVR